MNKRFWLSDAFKKAEPSENVLNWIKAYTAKGGQSFGVYSKYFTKENEVSFIQWAVGQPKVKNEKVFRLVGVSEKDWVSKFDSGYVDENNIINFGDKISSCSFDRRRTFTFGGKGEVKIVYEIESRGVGLIDISKYSVYPEEKEVIMLPNFEIKVVDWGVGHNNSIINIFSEEFTKH